MISPFFFFSFFQEYEHKQKEQPQQQGRQIHRCIQYGNLYTYMHYNPYLLTKSLTHIHLNLTSSQYTLKGQFKKKLKKISLQHIFMEVFEVFYRSSVSYVMQKNCFLCYFSINDLNVLYMEPFACSNVHHFLKANEWRKI